MPSGERLSHLADPKKLDLARAGLLLSPQIPMLWMGEKWSASTPFLFFVDFAPDEALNKAVREGRRKEFKSFAAFADDTSVISDPTMAETFAASKLDWSERERSPHREVLAETTRLLALRRDIVVPLAVVGLPRRKGGSAQGPMWSTAPGPTRAGPCASSPMSARRRSRSRAVTRPWSGATRLERLRATWVLPGRVSS